jgi:TPR repeat protein
VWDVDIYNVISRKVDESVKRTILLLFLCFFVASPCGRKGPTAEQMKVVNHGLLLLNKRQYKAAADRFRGLAEEGLTSAQEIMGILSEKGLGVPQSYRDAIKWYSMAAKQDNDRAQFCLGALYAEGRGLPRSEAAAESWFLKAKKNGNDYAQFRLDLLNREFESDHAYHQFLRQAAREGHAEAQYLLAGRFKEGRGVKANLQAALHWYSEAMKQKHFLAQYELMRIDPTLSYFKKVIQGNTAKGSQDEGDAKAAPDASQAEPPAKRAAENVARSGEGGEKGRIAAEQRKRQQLQGKQQQRRPGMGRKPGKGPQQAKRPKAGKAAPQGKCAPPKSK